MTWRTVVWLEPPLYWRDEGNRVWQKGRKFCAIIILLIVINDCSDSPVNPLHACLMQQVTALPVWEDLSIHAPPCEHNSASASWDCLKAVSSCFPRFFFYPVIKNILRWAKYFLVTFFIGLGGMPDLGSGLANFVLRMCHSHSQLVSCSLCWSTLSCSNCPLHHSGTAWVCRQLAPLMRVCSLVLGHCLVWNRSTSSLTARQHRCAISAAIRPASPSEAVHEIKSFALFHGLFNQCLVSRGDHMSFFFIYFFIIRKADPISSD